MDSNALNDDDARVLHIIADGMLRHAVVWFRRAATTAHTKALRTECYQTAARAEALVQNPKEQTMTDELKATPRGIEVLTKDCLIDVGNNEVTATVGARLPGVVRDDGSDPENTDVLSVQSDGTLQTRPEGTTGNFERAKVTSAGLVYRPLGIDGRAFLMPLAADWPNQ